MAQSGLTGLAQVGAFPFIVQDQGATYGTSAPQYTILINRDFATTRGIELSLRRRLENYWGFDLQYGYSQATTNAAEPEREFESQGEEGDSELRRETRSEIDQPHPLAGVPEGQQPDGPPELRAGLYYDRRLQRRCRGPGPPPRR